MATLAHEHAVPTQTHAEVTRDVIATLGKPSRGYVLMFVGAVTLFLIGLATFVALVKEGLGLAGYNPPVMWSVYITTFVFWVGIGHAGTLISAILYPLPLAVAYGGLSRDRGDDGLRHHDGRRCSRSSTSAGSGSSTGCCRIPTSDCLWPNFKSPLMWDVFAIGTYLTVSTTFLVVGLVPDIAAVRDKVSGLAQEALRVVGARLDGE